MDVRLLPIKILVADDEALARKRIIAFLKQYSTSFQIEEASNGKETLKGLQNQSPDLLFLDIKMTDMTGFDVLQKLPKEEIPIVIFVTAFDHFAVKAFEVEALDFLLKPYKKDRFIEALERGINKMEQKQKHIFQSKVTQLMSTLHDLNTIDERQRKTYIDQLVLRANKKYFFIKVKDINYIQSAAYYAEIFTLEGKKHLHRISLLDLNQKLDPQNFARINRSTIVNLKQIKEVISEGLGDYSLKMSDNQSFIVSKNYKVGFLKQMGIR